MLIQVYYKFLDKGLALAIDTVSLTSDSSLSATFVGTQVLNVGVSWLSGSVRDVQARDRGFDPRLR